MLSTIFSLHRPANERELYVGRNLCPDRRARQRPHTSERSATISWHANDWQASHEARRCGMLLCTRTAWRIDICRTIARHCRHATVDKPTFRSSADPVAIKCAGGGNWTGGGTGPGTHRAAGSNSCVARNCLAYPPGRPPATALCSSNTGISPTNTMVSAPRAASSNCSSDASP